ncbi:MAG TPA: site-2 protease family protein [Coriobacteriia bacterium]|nr:site-2 protease family protein [Coriobacteriia bacterium]
MPTFSTEQLIFGLIQLLCFVPAIVVHDFAHGFVANRLGDPTAKRAGRLSFNPLKHIDPFGTVILPILLALMGGPVFGYAKPVPYNPRYFKNLKQGEVLTGLAGPASNLIMALLAAGVALLVMPGMNLNTDTGLWIATVFFVFIRINLILMFFNLLPIPPLDGSSIIVPFLPQKALPTWYRIQQYALPVFFIIVFVLPMILPFSPLSAYLNATAGNLSNMLTPWLR